MREALHVSTSCLGSARLADRIAELRRAGLHQIELSQSVIPEPVEGWMSLLGSEGGLLVHNYFPPPLEPFVLNLASPDDSIRRRSLELVRSAIELSVRLGAPFYSVHAGFVTDPYAFGRTHFLFPAPDRLDARARALDRFHEALRQANAWASAAGIGLLVENNNCPPELREAVLVRTPEEILELMAAVGSPNLGVLLDTGHLRVAGATFGFDPVEAASHVSAHVRAVHLHDNDGTADYHRPVQAASPALAMLAALGPAPRVLVVEAHLTDVAGLGEHVRWLERELEQRGGR